MKMINLISFPYSILIQIRQKIGMHSHIVTLSWAVEGAAEVFFFNTSTGDLYIYMHIYKELLEKLG